MEEANFYHALKIDNDRCIGCTHCMKECPTGAIRIRDGKALIRGLRRVLEIVPDRGYLCGAG